MVIGGEHKIIEYDSWKSRDNQQQSQGYDECSSSIYIPCRTADTSGQVHPQNPRNMPNSPSNKMAQGQVKLPPDVPNKMAQVKLPTDVTNKMAKVTLPKSKSSKPIQTEQGFDVDEDIDFFWDLEDDIQKGGVDKDKNFLLPYRS